jgi:hypothetical protein
MKQPTYIPDVVTRILLPPMAGLFLYVAVLMVFGNLDQFGQSFFSQEALLIVLLAYLNHEWSVFVLRRKDASGIFTSGKAIRLVLHLALVLGGTVLLSSGIILVYFIWILGYYHFITELITLNSGMVLFQLLIQGYYIGIIQIGHLHAVSMEREEIQKEQLELELESFRHEMNPGLLMDCLETLISLVHQDNQDADQYIQALSEHYRYRLENRQREFVGMAAEKKSVDGLIYLLGKGGDRDLTVEYAEGQDLNKIRIIPGTLGLMVLYMVNNMIISSLSPARMHVSRDVEKRIQVCCRGRYKLVHEDVQNTNLKRLNRSYVHYTGSGITVSKEEDGITWEVPHIPEIVDN